MDGEGIKILSSEGERSSIASRYIVGISSPLPRFRFFLSLVSSRYTRRNAYTRASPIVHLGKRRRRRRRRRGRFTYFGVRLTDNNVSSSFRRMAPLPRPRHRGADFSLLCALKNQPATLTHAYRALRTMRGGLDPAHELMYMYIHTRAHEYALYRRYGIPLCDLTRTSARTRGHECNFS